MTLHGVPLRKRSTFLAVILFLFADNSLDGFAFVQEGSGSPVIINSIASRDYTVSINGRSIFIHIGRRDWITQKASETLSEIDISVFRKLAANGESGVGLQFGFTGSEQVNEVRLDIDGKEINLGRAGGLMISSGFRQVSAVTFVLSQADYERIKQGKIMVIKVAGRCFLLSDEIIRSLTNIDGS
jgi:hypothetical protein